MVTRPSLLLLLLLGAVLLNAGAATAVAAAPSVPSARPRTTPPSTGSTQTTSTTLAVLGIVAARDGSVNSTIGAVRKHPANPLFGQTAPWEAEINNGYPSVLYDPHDSLGTYRCWYNDYSAPQALAYANSSDGIVWDKPTLGIINLSSSVGAQNNLVLVGNGLGVYSDPNEPYGSAAKFKGFGQIGKNHGKLADHGGTIISADGLHWNSPEIYDWPDPPQRYDTANNVFYDDARQYVATTRRHPTTNVSDADRAIGIALSDVGSFIFNASAELPLVAQGTRDHQLYAQQTFKWHQIYLGIVMVYDYTDRINNRVHCRLAYSKAPSPLSGWEWVDQGGLTGRDFIPLGSSGPAGSAENAFDSHLCFASPPVHTPEGERLYYMGSNGKHSGSKPQRNASLGVALLRTDGFGGLSGSGTFTTVPINVTAETLTITADIIGDGGTVRLGVKGAKGLSLEDCENITANATGGKVTFTGGATLESMIGQEVVITVELLDAIVYTIGFRDDSPHRHQMEGIDYAAATSADSDAGSRLKSDDPEVQATRESERPLPFHAETEAAPPKLPFVLLPASAAAPAVRWPGTDSWGITVAKDEASDTYHAYVDVVTNNCSLGEWVTNSAIVHAVSKSPLGPFVRKETVLPAFASNPQLARAPDGEWLLFTIGDGKALAPDEVFDCSKQPVKPPKPSQYAGNVTSMHHSSSLDGPWKQVFGPGGSVLLPGFTNPAPHVMPNGSVVVLGIPQGCCTCDHGGCLHAATAPSWRGPFTIHRDRGE
jgi:hypothetical protein